MKPIGFKLPHQDPPKGLARRVSKSWDKHRPGTTAERYYKSAQAINRIRQGASILSVLLASVYISYLLCPLISGHPLPYLFANSKGLDIAPVFAAALFVLSGLEFAKIESYNLGLRYKRDARYILAGVTLCIAIGLTAASITSSTLGGTFGGEVAAARPASEYTDLVDIAARADEKRKAINSQISAIEQRLKNQDDWTARSKTLPALVKERQQVTKAEQDQTRRARQENGLIKAKESAIGFISGQTYAIASLINEVWIIFCILFVFWYETRTADEIEGGSIVLSHHAPPAPLDLTAYTQGAQPATHGAHLPAQGAQPAQNSAAVTARPGFSIICRHCNQPATMRSSKAIFCSDRCRRQYAKGGKP